MYCPYCGGESVVKATRLASSLTVLRNYQCMDNPKHKFMSREIHERAFSAAKRRIDIFANTVQNRIKLFERNKDIFHSWKKGVKVLMEMYGLSRSGVWLARWKYEDELGIPRTRRHKSLRNELTTTRESYDHATVQAQTARCEDLAGTVSSADRR